MANYTPSNFVAAQAKLLAMFQNAELRYREPAVFKEFLKSGQIMLPNYEQLRTREDRTVNTYYKQRKSRSLGTARSHNHTGAKGDSAEIALSWTTYTDPFLTTLKQSDNNLYNMQEMLDNELMNASTNFAEGLEALAAAYSHNNRSGVNVAAVDGGFDSVTKVYEIETSKEKRGIQILKTVMDINKYSNMLVIFCDSVGWNKVNFYANQGAANAENLQFQFAGIRFVHSPDLNASAILLGYTEGYFIAAAEGTFSALPWIPVQNRIGVETKVNSYTSFINPIDGLQYAVHSYQDKLDGTSTNGYTQDVKTEYQVSLDVAFNKAPLSTENETVFQAFGFVETLTLP